MCEVVMHSYRKKQILFLLSLNIIFCPVAKAEDIKIYWNYFRKITESDGGSYHICLKNDIYQTYQIEDVYLDGKKLKLAEEGEKIDQTKHWNYFPKGTKEGDALWYYLTETRIPPDGFSELIIKFAKAPIREGHVEVRTKENQKVHVTLRPETIPLTISYVGFSESFTKAFIYVQNNGILPLTIESVEIDGIKYQDSDRKGYALILPGDKRCFSNVLSKPLRQGKRIYVKIRTKEGFIQGVSVRAFNNFPILSEGGGLENVTFDDDGLNYKMATSDYQNLHYQFDIVGSRIIKNKDNPNYIQKNQILYFLSNQGLIKYSVLFFGELVDCFKLHPQPSEVAYLGRFNKRDFHYCQAKTRYAKEAVEPHPLYVICETAHAYGVYDKGMEPEEVRMRVYYMISRGAKGLFYRLGYLGREGKEHDGAIRKEVAKVNDELKLLKSLLKIGDNVDGIATTTEPLVEAATILGGDRGMVVILFNHDRSFAWPKSEMVSRKPFFIVPNEDNFIVKILLPNGVKVKDMYEVGGGWIKPKYTIKDNQLKFLIGGIDTTRQFVIDFGYGLYNLDTDRNGVIDMVEVMNKPLWRINKEFPDLPVIYPAEKPDIQFIEKQYFFGTVDLHKEVIRHRFEFKNAGQTVLKIGESEKVPDGLKVTIPDREIEPDKTGEVDVEYTPEKEGKVDLEFLVSTNDPNEPEIKLQIGGIVKKELTYYPENLVFDQIKGQKDVTVVDNKDGSLEITKVNVSSPEITYELESTSKTVIESYADVFGGERIVKTHKITINADLTKLVNKTDQFIEIETNNLHYPVLKIPIIIPRNIFVKIIPERFFFGFIKKGSKVSRKVMLQPAQNDKFELIEVNNPWEFITVEKVQLDKGHGYGLIATIDSTAPVGILQGSIKVHTNLPEQSIIEIPVCGMVRE